MQPKNEILPLRLFRRFCLWLVLDSNIRLGILAPYIFGIGIGRMPRKVKKDDSEGDE
jgi:hypothetical protein